MAIDTRQKRFSMMSFGSPIHFMPLFEADGSVDLDDRLHLLNLYGVGGVEEEAGVTSGGSALGRVRKDKKDRSEEIAQALFRDAMLKQAKERIKEAEREEREAAKRDRPRRVTRIKLDEPVVVIPQEIIEREVDVLAQKLMAAGEISMFLQEALAREAILRAEHQALIAQDEDDLEVMLLTGMI